MRVVFFCLAMLFLTTVGLVVFLVASTILSAGMGLARSRARGRRRYAGGNVAPVRPVFLKGRMGQPSPVTDPGSSKSGA